MKSLLLFCFLLLASAPAFAGPFELYGAGQRGRAMGAQTADGEGGFSLAYNPALLPSASTGISIGGFASFSNVTVKISDRPQGYLRTDQENTSPVQETSGGDPLYGVEIGANFETFVEGLYIGAAMFLPTNELIRLNTRYSDERESQSSNALDFELIQDRVHRPDIQLAISYEITDWLAFGIGGSFIPAADVLTDVYLDDPSDQENIDINATVSTKTRWGLLAGLRFAFSDDLHVGASFKSATTFEIAGENRIKIKGIDEEGNTRQTLDWLPLFSPAQGRVGVSWKGARTTWAFDWVYTLWSGYRDTHNENAQFRDTISGQIGAEYAYSSQTAVRVGVGFEPTPVRDQIDRTNYVDNHRAIVRLGSKHDLEFSGRALQLAWSAQGHLLVPRSTIKRTHRSYPECENNVTLLCDEQSDTLLNVETDELERGTPGLQTSNPGFPGFASGGWLAGISAEVSF